MRYKLGGMGLSRVFPVVALSVSLPAAALLLAVVSGTARAAIPSAPSFASNYSQVWGQDFAVMTSLSQLNVVGGYTMGNHTWISHTPKAQDWFTFIDPNTTTPAYNPFNVGNGYLTIRVANRGYGDPNNWFGGYSGGLLCSMDSGGHGFAQQFGYFEASMQTPVGANTWPAFWLNDAATLTNPALTRGAEIDVMESYGNWGAGKNNSPPGDPNWYNATWHLWSANSTGGSGSVHNTGMTTGFHTYGVDVEPTGIKWYFDRQQVWSAPYYAEAGHPLYVLLDLALGGGNYNNSTGTGYNWALTPNPSDLKVQYVAVWASPNSPNYVLSSVWNGGAGNWTSANWTSSVPGATSGTTSTNAATFNTVSAGTITVDAYRNVQSIVFDGSAGAFTLSNGNLFLTSGGAVKLGATAASFTGTNITETINTPITLEGDCSFTNNSATASNVLRFGGNITNGAAATLTLSGANAGANTISGVISDGVGATGFAKGGAGTWILSGANSYSGATAVGDGLLQLSGAGTLGSGAALTVSGGTLDLNGASPAVGTLSDGGSSTGAITSSSGSATLTINQGSSAAFSGNVTGASLRLVKGGAGSLTLSAANSYGGGTAITNGTLVLGNATAAGNGTITLGGSSGSANATLSIANNIAFANPIAVAAGNAGTATISSGADAWIGDAVNGAITLNNHDLTIVNAIGSNSHLDFTGGITGTGNLTINNTGTEAGVENYGWACHFNTNPVNYSGSITVTGNNGTVTFNSAIGANVTNVVMNDVSGNLRFNAAGSFSGNLIVKAGSVALSNAAAAGSNSITVGDPSGGNATLALNGVTCTNAVNLAPGAAGTLTLGGGAYPASGGGTFSGPISLNGNNVVLQSGMNGNVTFSGGITGQGNITVTNSNSNKLTISTNALNNTGTFTNAGATAGTTTVTANIGSNVTNIIQNSAVSPLVVSGTNTYTGTVSIQAGILGFGNRVSLYNGDTSKWTAANINVKSGATLMVGYKTNAANFQAADVDTLRTNLDAASGGFESGAYLGFDMGPPGGSWYQNPSYDSVIANPRSGANVLGVVVTQTTGMVNVLKLTGTNTYTGPTLVKGAALAVTSLADGDVASSIGKSSNAASNLVIGSSGTLKYVGGAASTDRLFSLGFQEWFGTAATIDASGTGPISFTNTGRLAYVSTNQPQLTLTGTNTSANILALAIDNNAGNATTLTKNGSGTWVLTGTNAYSGGTAVQAGKFKIIGSIRNTGSATVGALATLELAGATGSATAAGLAVSNAGTLEVSTIAQEAGTIAGAGITQVDTGASLTADSIVQNTLTIGAGGSVTIRETTGGSSTVPEPSTFVLLGVGALGLLAYAWRRRKQART